jgi:hypothetical protein
MKSSLISGFVSIGPWGTASIRLMPGVPPAVPLALALAPVLRSAAVGCYALPPLCCVLLSIKY